MLYPHVKICPGVAMVEADFDGNSDDEGLSFMFKFMVIQAAIVVLSTLLAHKMIVQLSCKHTVSRHVQTDLFMPVLYGLWTVEQLQFECKVRRCAVARTKEPMVRALIESDEVLVRPSEWTPQVLELRRAY